jgi:hypothetical protein
MLNKKQYLKKKYDLLKDKDKSLYFYFSPLKANETRKLRRLCNLQRNGLFFLPSRFSFTGVPKSHGPSIMCVTFENLSLFELNLAKAYQDTTCVLKYKTHLSLIDKNENLKDNAKKFTLMLSKNSK